MPRTPNRPEPLDEPPPLPVFEKLSRLGFIAVAVILIGFALLMAVYGISLAVLSLNDWSAFGLAVLRGVGFLIVAIAVFEVAKYLIDEEVLRGREMRGPTEARRSLTRFISTIAIAVFLEGLVSVFRVSHENVVLMLYPVSLLLTGILLVLGLGLFQYLSAGVEQKVRDRD